MGISWGYHEIHLTGIFMWNQIPIQWGYHGIYHQISWYLDVWKLGTPTKINYWDIMGKYLLPTMGIRNELQGLHLQDSMEIFVDFFRKNHNEMTPIGSANRMLALWYSKLLVITRGYHQLVKSQDWLATHDLASGIGYPGYPQLKKVLVSWYTPFSDSKCHQISWHIPLHHIYISDPVISQLYPKQIYK